MESKIKELIDKYDDKRLEEPDYYFQWEEILEDLKSLLEFKQKLCDETRKAFYTEGWNDCRNNIEGILKNETAKDKTE